MWTAILDSESAREATRVAIRMARTRSQTALDDTLSEGKLALALLLEYAARAEVVADSEPLVHGLLESAIDGHASRGALDVSLYRGVTGWAWLCQHLYTGEPDDGLDEIASLVETRLAAGLRELDYGVMGGIVGAGIYALEALNRPAARSLLDGVLDTLAARAAPHSDGISWKLPPPRYRPESAPRGYYNLGLPHGVPGILALLAEVHARADGELKSKAASLLDAAMPWLLAQRQVDAASAYPEWIGPGVVARATGLGWCYGDLGVCSVLVRAARTMQRPAWERAALEIGRAALAFEPRLADVADLGLCHGLASTAHLCNRLFQMTGDAIFRGTAERTIRRLLDRLGADSSEPAHAGLLSGSIGIALALLAASSAIEPAWDRLLLLS